MARRWSGKGSIGMNLTEKLGRCIQPLEGFTHVYRRIIPGVEQIGRALSVEKVCYQKEE